jgi:hypothetical protein
MAYSTAEEAARGDIPSRYARALAVEFSPDGDHAVVLLETNEPPFVYPYQVVCSRGEDGWAEGISGNGPGQTLVEGTLWVRTEWRETAGGHVLMADWWDEPE